MVTKGVNVYHSKLSLNVIPTILNLSKVFMFTSPFPCSNFFLVYLV